MMSPNQSSLEEMFSNWIPKGSCRLYVLPCPACWSFLGLCRPLLVKLWTRELIPLKNRFRLQFTLTETELFIWTVLPQSSEELETFIEFHYFNRTGRKLRYQQGPAGGGRALPAEHQSGSDGAGPALPEPWEVQSPGSGPNIQTGSEPEPEKGSQ